MAEHTSALNNALAPEPLLISAREAAKRLSISERTLWAHTYPRGTIPCVKIGQRVLYRYADLAAWCERMAQGGAP